MDEQKVALIQFIVGIVLALMGCAFMFSGTFSIYVQVAIGLVGIILIIISKPKLFG